jgi:hypothetical protein
MAAIKKSVKKVKKYQVSGPPLRKPYNEHIEVETGEPRESSYSRESSAQNLSKLMTNSAEARLKKLKNDKERMSRMQNALNKASDETGLKYKKGGKVTKKAKTGAKVDGKWMQKVSKSIKARGTEGKCTPITKPGCTGKAKALAKTFKKIAAKRKAK